ncbi:MAG: hypothetical protein QNJ97_18145 [Myxococcota bacterium]|nr:hypothetical protein [Myxococcota bacterium]
MSFDWTYIIDEPRRTELLRGFGLSEKVIALGSGENLPDPVFDFYCNKPKYVLKEASTPPDAEPLAGIFESRYNEAYACGKWENKIAFVYFNFKHLEDVTSYGASEQSLLRALFEEIVDSEFHKRDDIERAAAAVGFRFLPDTYAYVFSERERAMKGERKRDMKAYFERRLAYIRGVSKPATTNPGV